MTNPECFGANGKLGDNLTFEREKCFGANSDSGTKPIHPPTCCIGLVPLIPYSAEAVEALLKVERQHIENYMGFCAWPDHEEDEIWDPETEDEYFGSVEPYPCPTLVEARSLAALETKVAVALILGGER